MEIYDNNRTVEARTSSALSWLERAQKDHRAFDRVVGQGYIRSKSGSPPDDPALAIYLLQQAAEKTVKAIAIASGKFEDNKLKYNYSHNSLTLMSDVLLSFFDFPFVAPVSKIIKESLGEKGGKFLGPSEVQLNLDEMKRNTAPDKKRAPHTPDWLTEFAMLSPKEVNLNLTVMLALRSKLESGLHRQLRPHIVIDVHKIRQYADDPTKTKLAALLEPAFRDRAVSKEKLEFVNQVWREIFGQTFESAIKEVLKNRGPIQEKHRIEIGKRQIFEEALRSAWALSALMFLAALTFAHAEWTRYPRDPRSAGKELSCDSYTKELGIVSCLRDLGRLCENIVYDIEPMIENVAQVFAAFDGKTMGDKINLNLILQSSTQPKRD